jgi:hypothetical protein
LETAIRRMENNRKQKKDYNTVYTTGGAEI